MFVFKIVNAFIIKLESSAPYGGFFLDPAEGKVPSGPKVILPYGPTAGWTDNRFKGVRYDRIILKCTFGKSVQQDVDSLEKLFLLTGGTKVIQNFRIAH